MKVSLNSVGNYNPAPSALKANQKENPLPKYQQENISKEEKDFFVNKYPENKSEILDYHFYQRSGKLSGVSIGSLFDKRG